jgi:16S rRNA (guanine527-N7)-methyltransferase
MNIPISSETWQNWTGYVREQFGVTLSEPMLRQFQQYLEELIAWNEKFNLVSFRSPDELLWRHCGDSLSGAKIIKEYRTGKPEGSALTVADIGTGAGFPGIPIKIVFPDIQLTLVESITKKCSFLEHSVKVLDLSHTAILNERAEIIGQEKGYRAKYDLALSRALSKPSANLEVTIPLLKMQGKALLYKTKKFVSTPEEMQTVERVAATLGARLAGTFCYHIPTEEQEYCVLVLDKVKETPPQYPRRVGVPEKKPM